MMKPKLFFLTTLYLSLVMCGLFTSCKSKDASSEQATTPGTTASGIESGAETNKVPEGETSAETEKETEYESEGSDTYIEPVITGPYADTIMLSNRLANGVQAYYANAKRTHYRIENQNMHLEYAISSSQDNLITSLSTPDGKTYLENTVDVFVRMENGKTYMASGSTAAPHTNIYRMGYYYYDAHIMGQNFMGDSTVAKEMDFTINKASIKFHDAKAYSVKDGIITYTAAGNFDIIQMCANR